MKNITTLWLLIKSFYLKFFTIKNARDETSMQAYSYGPGNNFLLVGDDVYRMPDDFTCDEFLALEMKDVYQFEKCVELTRSFFEPATFDE